MPFEALLDSNGHYLIERAPIVHSLGQDSQARLRATRISPDSPALVVGSAASSPADGLIPLPDVAVEADAVASSFHSAHVLKGGEVTLSAIRSELPGAAVFHFAGHALAASERTGSDAGRRRRTRTPSTCWTQPLFDSLICKACKLAVLSACNTAPAAVAPADSTALPMLFCEHACPMWSPADGRWTRSRIIVDFYRNVLSGQTVSDAIRLTSQNMLVNPRTSHPYYWSAFAAYGRP